MAEEKPQEPLGFTGRTRSLAGEYAHEQGWGLNEDERTRINNEQLSEGGKDYDYGPRDFGDTPTDTGAAKPSPAAIKFLTKDPKILKDSTPKE